MRNKDYDTGDISMERKLLSICIALHNRSDIVNEHILELLKCKDERFDIVVSDSSDNGKGLLDSYNYNDPIISVYRIDPSTPAMRNWMSALDHADGLFAFHLNDRDVIHSNQLEGLIDFLETHSSFNGGICKCIRTYSENQLFEDEEKAFMNIPFFASHPTGMVFNVDRYKSIKNRERIFDAEVGIHPHDLILANLSQFGKMFIFTKNVWDLASDEYYIKNKSGFEKGKSSLFFEPNERMRELTHNIQYIENLDFNCEIKQKKVEQMFKTYLGLSTNTYFYVLESEHETAHYGIKKERFGLLRRLSFANSVLDSYAATYSFSIIQKREYKKWLLKTILIPVLGKYSSKISNKTIKEIIHKMRVRRYSSEDALLR